MGMLHKQYISKSDVDADERTVTAIISTGAIDRDKEVLSPRGANFDSFRKNPVVLFGHQHSQTPIGKAIWIKRGNKTIKAKIQFADTEKANEVFSLFKGGFMNAFSVGFLPTKSHSPTPAEIKKRPELAEARLIFDEWELLEFSAVPVPSNPEALATAVKCKDITVSDELAEELGLEETILMADVEVDETESTTGAAKIGDVHELQTASNILTPVKDIIDFQKPVVLSKSTITLGRPIVVLRKFVDVERIASDEIKRIRGIIA